MRAIRPARILAAFCLAMAPAGVLAAATPATAQAPGKTMTTSSGLQITDSKVGTGATPKPGQTAVVHYTGWLYQDGAKGKKFDSSVDRGQPFEFPLGQRRVIGGWDEGVATMKVGGKRTLSTPPELAHGARGGAPASPPRSSRPSSATGRGARAASSRQTRR